MTGSMIERVAASQADFDGRTLISMPKTERERYYQRARAAIEAMREPTEPMLTRGARVNVGPRSSVHGYIYAAMIHAALSEEAK